METLISSLLRPYRFTYSLNDLGNKHHPQYTRKDHYLLNQRDLKLQYSYYQHRNESNVCAVYCHCNSGSRVEGIPYIEQFVAKGWNVCLFDFSGSGNSEGEFISLGYHESRDLECILKQLRSLNNHRFVLWGRSMGASTSNQYHYLELSLFSAKQNEEKISLAAFSTPLCLTLFIDQTNRDSKIRIARIHHGENH